MTTAQVFTIPSLMIHCFTFRQVPHHSSPRSLYKCIGTMTCFSSADKDKHQYFECRIAFLCTHWNLFHTCKSLLDIKTCLDNMDARSHHLLVAFHVAYFQSQVNLELSFGQTKQNFYQLAHQGHFQYDTFDTSLWHQSRSNFFLLDLPPNGMLILLGIASSCMTSRWILLSPN